MHVVDAVGEGLDEQHRVHELVVQVAGVEVDAEAGPVADRLQRLLGGHDIVGDLGGVDLQAEAHALRRRTRP